MVRDVFVQVRQDQEQFKHAVSLLGMRLTSLLLEILDDGKRVCQQPFDVIPIQRTPVAAAIERVIGAIESFVEKMVKT